MKTVTVTTALVICSICMAGELPGSEPRLADSLQIKLDHIRENGKSSDPDPAQTVMTEEEINSYFAAGRVKLPLGIGEVSFVGQSGLIIGTARIDFDEIRSGRQSPDPLLAPFSGTRIVQVEADATATGGVAKIHVLRVTIDGIFVRPIALEAFLREYVAPRYPGVAVDTIFRLSDRMDTATVGYHKLIVTQK